MAVTMQTNPTTTAYKVGDTFNAAAKNIRNSFPVGTVLIHAQTGTAHTVASWESGKIFQDTSFPTFVLGSGNATYEYKVAWIPKAVEKPADPVGDLAVKLIKTKYNHTAGDYEWVRTSTEWRRLAEFVRKNFVAMGTRVIIDDDSECWVQMPNGNFSMGCNYSRGYTGRDRAYIRDTYGIRAESVLY